MILTWPDISVTFIKNLIFYTGKYIVFLIQIIYFTYIGGEICPFCRSIYFCVQFRVSVPSSAFLYALVYQLFLWNDFVHLLFSMNLEFLFLQPTRFLVILLHEVLTYFSILLYEWPSPTLISDPCQNKYGTIINIL